MTLALTLYYTRRFGLGEEIAQRDEQRKQVRSPESTVQSPQSTVNRRGERSGMSNTKRSPWLTLTALLVYFFLYAPPIVVLILFSFNAAPERGLRGRGQSKGVPGVLLVLPITATVMCWRAARNTLVIALTSTFFATIIGTMAALALQRFDFFGKGAAETSLYFPIVTPEIVMGIGILVLFGWINTMLALAPNQRLTHGDGHGDHLAHRL